MNAQECVNVGVAQKMFTKLLRKHTLKALNNMQDLFTRKHTHKTWSERVGARSRVCFFTFAFSTHLIYLIIFAGIPVCRFIFCVRWNWRAA